MNEWIYCIVPFRDKPFTNIGNVSFVKGRKKKTFNRSEKKKEKNLFSFLSSTFWATERDIYVYIHRICCILSIFTENQSGIGTYWRHSGKREHQNFSLLLCFEEWLLQRPALYFTWVCVTTYEKPKPSLLTCWFCCYFWLSMESDLALLVFSIEDKIDLWRFYQEI